MDIVDRARLLPPFQFLGAVMFSANANENPTKKHPALLITGDHIK